MLTVGEALNCKKNGLLPVSVTRFGRILPIVQNFKSLGQFCKYLSKVCQNFEPTFAILNVIGNLLLLSMAKD